MPWKVTGPMTEREAFVRTAMAFEAPFAALCAVLGISRRFGYMWLHRFDIAGVSGLR